MKQPIIIIVITIVLVIACRDFAHDGWLIV